MNNENVLTDRERLIIDELVDCDGLNIWWSNYHSTYYYSTNKVVFAPEFARLVYFGLIREGGGFGYYPTVLARQLYGNKKTGAESDRLKNVKRSSFGVKIGKYFSWCGFSAGIFFLVLMASGNDISEAMNETVALFGGMVAGGGIYTLLLSREEVDKK